MRSLDIKINIKELTNYSASSDLIKKKKTLLLMIKSFAEYLRSLYLHLIKEEINSKRYQGNWEPIEEKGYQEYLGVSPQSDIYLLVEDAMEVKKLGNNFVVRINPYYKYPDTRIPLLKVLRAIENGTSDFNARPLMSKVVLELQKNVIDYWRAYLAMKGVI